MSYFIFVSGGARSGKSVFAEECLNNLSGGREKFYVAAMKNDPKDYEALSRIKRHQQERANKNFITIEREKNFISEIPEHSNILIESLSTWTSNEMFCDGNINSAELVYEKISYEIELIKKISDNLVIVSDDIFSDGVVYDHYTEQYIFCLGRLHIFAALKSDEAYQIISGLPIKFK